MKYQLKAISVIANFFFGGGGEERKEGKVTHEKNVLKMEKEKNISSQTRMILSPGRLLPTLAKCRSASTDVGGNVSKNSSRSSSGGSCSSD